MLDSPTHDSTNASRDSGTAAPAPKAMRSRAVPPDNVRVAGAANPRTLADSLAAEIDDLLIF